MGDGISCWYNSAEAPRFSTRLPAWLPQPSTPSLCHVGSSRRSWRTRTPSAPFVLLEMSADDVMPPPPFSPPPSPPPLAGEHTKQQQFPWAGIASRCSRLQLISSSCREAAHTAPTPWFPHCSLWFWWAASSWRDGGSKVPVQFVAYWLTHKRSPILKIDAGHGSTRKCTLHCSSQPCWGEVATTLTKLTGRRITKTTLFISVSCVCSDLDMTWKNNLLKCAANLW